MISGNGALITFVLLFFAPAIALAESAEEIIDKAGCRHCHLIKGNGAVVAPPLDGINRFITEAHIKQKLLSPKLPTNKPYPVPEDLMSHTHLNESDAQKVAKYLIALPVGKMTISDHQGNVSVAPPGSSFIPEKESKSSARGEKLFLKNGCIACHAIGPAGGKIGPNLAGVGGRRTRQYIEERIKKGALILPRPDESSGKLAMPRSKLSASDIADLTNWLRTLPPRKVR
jgi:nitric oxide reductase subunit C